MSTERFSIPATGLQEKTLYGTDFCGPAKLGLGQQRIMLQLTQGLGWIELTEKDVAQLITELQKWQEGRK